jgi:hypothetical protein
MAIERVSLETPRSLAATAIVSNVPFSLFTLTLLFFVLVLLFLIARHVVKFRRISRFNLLTDEHFGVGGRDRLMYF